MARKRPADAGAGAEVVAPAPVDRAAKRGRDEHGNTRPADGRWDLHDPEVDEA